MKKKKKLLANSVLAATVATSVIAIPHSADAASTSNLSKAKQAVVKAEKLAGALKWETSVDYRKTKYPTNLVGYPNMKLHNDTKNALAEAKNAVAKLKGKDKEVYSARLDANVTTYVNRSVAYIDAVTSGLNIQKVYKQLQAKAAKNVVDDQTEKLYHQLSYEIKKNAFMLDRVYGVTTREEFREFYKKTAERQMADLLYPVTIKMEIDRASSSLKANDVEGAAKHLGNVDYFIKEAAAKKGQKETSKLIVNSQAKLQSVVADFTQKASLYVAKSTDASAPSTFGPASGSDTINKTVYVYAGVDGQVKLQNLSINGNVVVLGSPAGGGSVYLDNVKVNGDTAAAGNIIVEDIADHSLHLKGVEAGSVTVKDTDGYNIVAEQGTKVKSLVISDQAGAKGKGTIDAQASGAFETITIESKGSANSAGVELKGDLSGVTIVVTGENAVINVAPGTIIKEIIFKAPAKVTISEGATVKKVSKDPSVKGDVTITNNGTIEQATSDIVVIGKAPADVIPPIGGTPTPPIVTPDPNQPVLRDQVVLLGDGTSTHPVGTLDQLKDEALITGLQFTTEKAAQFSLTSIKVGTYTFTPPVPLAYNVSQNKTFTIKLADVFGVKDLSMGELRSAASGQKITLNGKINTYPVTIDINLGALKGLPITAFKTDYGTITKKGLDSNGKHTLEVAILDSMKTTRIFDIESKSGGVNYFAFLYQYALGHEANVAGIELIKNYISGKLNGKAWNEITLADLASFDEGTGAGVITRGDYKVEFKIVK